MTGKMMRLAACLAAAFLMTAVWIPSAASDAYGAEAAVTLTGGGAYGLEEPVRVTLTYSGDQFGTAVAIVNYDDVVLEYKSCSGGEAYGGEGTVRVNLDGGTGSSQLSCKLKFAAKSVGDAFVTATTSNLCNLDMETLQAATRSVKVSVQESSTAPAADGNGENDAENTVNEKETQQNAQGDIVKGTNGEGDEADAEYGSRQETRGFLETAHLRFIRFLRGLDATTFLLLCMALTGSLLLIALHIAGAGGEEERENEGKTG